tara:strand:- start:1460 stop:1612 length:153 start_codon:yes stop_codon:yes gene_type:complete
MVSGGTAYAPALKMAKDISGKTEGQFSKIIYYFMSDGAPWDEQPAYAEIN